MPTTDRDDAYREGHAAGGDMGKSAIDCPYIPPDPRREAWMEGFSVHRPSVSPASDPDSFEGGEEGDGPEHPLPPLHEG